MNHVKELIRCPSSAALGVTGRGIGVAVLDTGVYLHRDFDSRIAGFADFVGRRTGPYDDCGHGTHICGIIGGSGIVSDGRYEGMAPGCRLIPVKVLDRKGNGSVAGVLRGIDWIIRNKDVLGIRIVNISVGSGGNGNAGKRGRTGASRDAGVFRRGGGSEAPSEDSALVRGVDRAWDVGLVVVVAAGNNGPARMSITTPGISRKVITVGCSDDDREVLVGGSRMVDYSGRGPTAACICKPDVVAPGSSVVSCANRAGRYTIKSGTSMSTPIVSGAIALLLERYPHLTNRDVKLRLMETCRDIGLPRNQQGWGLLDVERLLR